MEPRSPSKLKVSFVRYRRSLKICIALALVLILLIGIYGIVILSRSSYFTVVVDCGSTGTRVDLYEWRTRGIGDMDLPVLMHSYPDNSTKNSLWKDGCKYHCLQTEPGLDKFVGNFSGVRASLEPLIVYAEQQIPPEKHKDTPIFILATAGLRQLATEDGELVLKDVETVVKEHSFRCKKSWIRVLSGKEEAYYGWVALNHKMGSLHNSSPFSTSGLLDLGGSSLQVVMEVEEDLRENEHFVRSKIGSVEHQILAYSLPAFGLNEAFDRTVVILSQEKSTRVNDGGKLEIRHPCLSSSLVKNYSCNGCFRPKNSDSEKYAHIWNSGSIEVVLAGDQNWEQCKGLARAAAVNSSSSDWRQLTTGSYCKTSSSFNGRSLINLTDIPTQIEPFHALSGFYAVYNKLNLSTRANMTKVWENGEHLCSTSFLEPASIYAQYCFNVPYMASLIEDALCLGDAEIYFGPGDVSWTLGAALVEGNHNHSWHITVEYHTRISIFLFLLLMGLVFIVYRTQIKLPMLGKKRTDGGTSLPSYIHPRRRPN